MKFFRNFLKVLPATVLSRRPFVFAAYDWDFLKRVPEFAAALRNTESPALLLQLGWQHETPSASARLAAGIRRAVDAVPGLRVTVLANAAAEVQSLAGNGIETVLCHQNAFLDERRYLILPHVKKIYDAIYIARITPFKRHNLAAGVKSLRLIGSNSQYEAEYARAVLAKMPDAVYSSQWNSRLIYYPINQAHCGLCLSCEEGAMFVSAEYLLCGIPIVNTANIGGRDLMFPPFAVRNVPDSPEAVAEAVAHWAAKAPDPQEVRRAALELMMPYRTVLIELLRKLGVKESLLECYQKHFPHKLGLRVSRAASLLKVLSGNAILAG